MKFSLEYENFNKDACQEELSESKTTDYKQNHNNILRF